ncbi:MAG: hypothetical protein EOM69_08080, partial [Clostridia bacterium]|nr:hypothetical protein [Clostridia bacterium]
MTEALAVTRYTLSVHTPAPEGAVFRIAVAADLHNRSGDAALAAIAREKPDCVVIAGDLIESCRPSELMEREMQGDLRQYSAGKRWLMRTVIRADAVLGGARRDSFDPENRKGFAFLQSAVRLAPVYYGLGNHEQYLSPQTKAQIRQTGATLLENASVPLQTALGKLHMGALTTLPDRKWLSSFCALSGLKVLICHHPEYFERFLDDQPLTLVLAGHAHGGQ